METDVLRRKLLEYLDLDNFKNLRLVSKSVNRYVMREPFEYHFDHMFLTAGAEKTTVDDYSDPLVHRPIFKFVSRRPEGLIKTVSYPWSRINTNNYPCKVGISTLSIDTAWFHCFPNTDPFGDGHIDLPMAQLLDFLRTACLKTLKLLYIGQIPKRGGNEVKRLLHTHCVITSTQPCNNAESLHQSVCWY